METRETIMMIIFMLLFLDFVYDESEGEERGGSKEARLERKSQTQGQER